MRKWRIVRERDETADSLLRHDPMLPLYNGRGTIYNNGTHREHFSRHSQRAFQGQSCKREYLETCS